jgi:hypothetical protein
MIHHDVLTFEGGTYLTCRACRRNRFTRDDNSEEERQGGWQSSPRRMEVRTRGRLVTQGDGLQAAAVNPGDKFELVFKNLLETLFVERMDQNEAVPARAYSSTTRSISGVRTTPSAALS